MPPKSKVSMIGVSAAMLLMWVPWCATGAEPKAEFVLGNRSGECLPRTTGHSALAEGGTVSVEQPSADVVIVTMRGAAAARSHPLKPSQAALTFQLNQDFQILLHGQKSARLLLEARVIGTLRSGQTHEKSVKAAGEVAQDVGSATVFMGPHMVVAANVEPHVLTGGEDLSVNCKAGPFAAPVFTGCYALSGTFAIRASRNRSLIPCAGTSADFGPTSLESSWVDGNDPFDKASKEDFGFQIKMRLISG